MSTAVAAQEARDSSRDPSNDTDRVPQRDPPGAEHPWIVHKFGGTSVADPERYQHVAGVLQSEPGPRKAVVVSAMSGVTDALFGLTDLARKRDETVVDRLDALRQRHVDAAHTLARGAVGASIAEAVTADTRDLADILRAMHLARACPDTLTELVAGYGELWSARLLAATLAHGRPAGSVAMLDAREVLTVRRGETGPNVDWERSRSDLHRWLEGHTHADTLVITGYIARTPDGAPTTLQRNGSDYSAAIFGALLDAPSITIWTDVDGVLSADPRRVPEAIVLTETSYDEAMELAYFGAKVLHPRTMSPAVERGIPIWIRNTFNPGCAGTRIHGGPFGRKGTGAVKGITTVDGVSLVNVEGTGMIGVPGIAQRLFAGLREVGVSVVMISQASSEHSICFAVPEAQGALARDVAARVFHPHDSEETPAVQRVELVSGCSILAAVGDDMSETPGVAGRLFTALGKANVNVRAIAQGSSERNISVVISREASTRALRAVHSGFYLSDQTLSVGVLGPGNVGAALLRQIEAQGPVLRSRFKIDLRLRGVGDSQRMFLADAAMVPSDALTALRAQKGTRGIDLDDFAQHIRAEHLPHAVIIDCTASDALADQYAHWLSRGIHVITPNKRAGAGPLARMRGIEGYRARFYAEATVGAGLPVITTLRDILRTGDTVHKIEGVLSGTLAYVFNALSGGARFSDVVRDAHDRGYTEPDPRDDLSGVDVARKLVILAREMGYLTELSDVVIDPVVPDKHLSAGTPEDFLTGLTSYDPAMSALVASTVASGAVLRHVGSIDAHGRCAVGLRSIPASHPFARTSSTDNILAFSTARYHPQPLIVQGPGAGPDVTAGGIFADLLRLAAHLGATV